MDGGGVVQVAVPGFVGRGYEEAERVAGRDLGGERCPCRDHGAEWVRMVKR